MYYYILQLNWVFPQKKKKKLYKHNGKRSETGVAKHTEYRSIVILFTGSGTKKET
jgi:hypothetical protein